MCVFLLEILKLRFSILFVLWWCHSVNFRRYALWRLLGSMSADRQMGVGSDDLVTGEFTADCWFIPHLRSEAFSPDCDHKKCRAAPPYYRLRLVGNKQWGREIQTIRDNLPESRLTGENISIKLMWEIPHSNITMYISLTKIFKYYDSNEYMQ